LPKNSLIICLLAVLAALATSASAGEMLRGSEDSVATMSDAEYDAQFKCPEALSPRKSGQAMIDFMIWVASQHPAWTIADGVKARRGLLERHRCSVTLAAIRAGQQAAEKTNAQADDAQANADDGANAQSDDNAGTQASDDDSGADEQASDE
jgi:hypothetical protein